MYRLATAAAVLFTWFLISLLGITSHPFAFLIPLAVLAFFQQNEKWMSKYFNRKQ
jgi:hypothetical protein